MIWMIIIAAVLLGTALVMNHKQTKDLDAYVEYLEETDPEYIKMMKEKYNMTIDGDHAHWPLAEDGPLPEGAPKFMKERYE